ncbi:MAG: peptidylprolyl isomerase [Oscillospiraceae bacterium]|nr:peptidylprolyl isomerase [Oscillospiraceae bacterium]
MQCPNCGQELSDRDLICPGCGWSEESAAPEAIAEPVEVSSPEPEVPESDAVPEEIEAPEPEVTDASDEAEAEISEETGETEEADSSDVPDASDPEEETAESEEEDAEPARKKRSILPAVLGAIVGLLAIIIVCLTITLTTLSRTGKMPAFVTSIQNAFHREHFDADAVAVRILDADGGEVSALDNEQFSFYYWGEIYYFIQSNGLVFDPGQPLDEQEYMDGQTWQDFFLENANTSIQQVESMKADALAAGYTLPEAYQEQYDAILSSMPEYAKQSGFTDDDGNGDILAYVQDSYGASATEETFRDYLYDSYLVTAYSDEIYAQVTVDDAALEDWYDENAEMYESYGITKSDVPNVNVRHILIAPAVEEGATEEESQKAKDEAKAEAERILKEWQEGAHTEESFGELAATYSTDGGSNLNGGLYENVYPGQMVEAFNDWCFDESRTAGDTGIVETDFGYHIIYFAGTTDNYYWKQAAESDLHYKLYDDALQAIVNHYTVEPTEDLELSTPTAISTLAEEAEAQAAEAEASAAG